MKKEIFFLEVETRIQTKSKIVNLPTKATRVSQIDVNSLPQHLGLRRSPFDIIDVKVSKGICSVEVELYACSINKKFVSMITDIDKLNRSKKMKMRVVAESNKSGIKVTDKNIRFVAHNREPVSLGFSSFDYPE